MAIYSFEPVEERTSGEIQMGYHFFRLSVVLYSIARRIFFSSSIVHSICLTQMLVGTSQWSVVHSTDQIFSFVVSVLWQRRADRASFSPGRHCHTTIRGPDWILLLFHRRPCSTDVDVDEVYRLQGRVHVNVINEHMLAGRLCGSPQRNNSVLGGPW